MPGLLSEGNFDFGGVAIASRDEWPTVDTEQEVLKAEKLIDGYGGKIYTSYHECIESKDLDAIYIPLPPSLHAYWGKRTLEAGKHLLLEKPFTTNCDDTEELVLLAQEKNLAIHENYAFIYHRRIRTLLELLHDNSIGDIRLVRADFGFPYRGVNDFRYNKALGGGALLDCGGYPLKLASLLLDDCSVISSFLGYSKIHDVDIYGSAMLYGKNHMAAQIGFGMDNSYRCDLEIWGETGYMILPRVFTPPSDMKTEILITRKTDTQHIEIQPDDQFAQSIGRFHESIRNNDKRVESMQEILAQSKAITAIRNQATNVNGEKIL